jgi:hypothetical protein
MTIIAISAVNEISIKLLAMHQINRPLARMVNQIDG